VSLFSAIGIAGSGVDAMQTWIDTSGGNIANANDAVAVGKPTYAEETTVLSADGSPVPGDSGVGVTATVAPPPASWPTSPTTPSRMPRAR